MKSERKILKLVAIVDGQKHYLAEFRGGGFRIEDCTIEEWDAPTGSSEGS